MTALAPEAGIPRSDPEAPAGEVRKGLVGRSFASAVDLAVCDGERFVGLVPIERLLAAAAGRPVGELAEPAVRVRAGVDEELAAAWLARNGGRSLAVVGDDDAFVGLVLPSQAVTVLLREHEEDLARLGGFLARTSQARTAAEEPVHRRLWHRLPWLALGLLGAMGSAGIVAAFEEELSRQAATATLVAMALPYGLSRLGRDPAFGAGPLATVIQDLLSIVIYFAIALALTG
jgi:magnesium transporter